MESLLAMEQGDLIFSFSETPTLCKVIGRVLGKSDVTRMSHISLYMGEDHVCEHLSHRTDLVRRLSMTKVTARDPHAVHGRIVGKYNITALIALASLDQVDRDSIPGPVRRTLSDLFCSDTRRLAVADAQWLTHLFRICGLDLVPGKGLAQVSPVDILFSPHIELTERFIA